MLVYYKATLMENVTVEHIFNTYANYLEEPQNIDINYQVNIIMQIQQVFIYESKPSYDC